MKILDILVTYVLPALSGGGLTYLFMWKVNRKNAHTEAAGNEVTTFGTASEVFVSRLMETTEHLRKATELATNLKESRHRTQSKNRLLEDMIQRHLTKCTTSATELADELDQIKKLYSDEK